MKKHRFLFLIGLPFTPIYCAMMVLRAFLYRKGVLKSHLMGVPVVSVGNLTMGGTAKTPMVMYLARYFSALEKKPAIVSRGYGGTAKGPVNVVSDQKEIFLDSKVAGDEPRLLAESLPCVPVLTGPKKVVVGRYAVLNMTPDILILDDGFQHLAMRRDLDIVLFNARNYLGNGRVFPGGELREPLSALKRADVFVISGVNDKNMKRATQFRRKLHADFPDKPVFMGRYQPICLLHSQRKGGIEIDKARRLPLYGFCGLADPSSFKQTLKSEKFKIVGFKEFADHHAYSSSDVKELAKAAKARKAKALITTEKDFVKLKPFAKDIPILILKVEFLLDEEFDLYLRTHVQFS
ncbi:MAG: tetraacyldisaccharide 4'-kinase, partial [Desulfobulbaceae bacterium]|nr:tetraacyldisaccharide 4'-kinase [Desulfobulbaceae bacterium]